MKTMHGLSHTKWDCKYHIVWIPKYRKKTLFWELRQELGPVLKDLARHKARYWKDVYDKIMCMYRYQYHRNMRYHGEVTMYQQLV